MLPITVLPDIAASIAATAIIRLIVPKLVKKGVEEATVRSLKKLSDKKTGESKTLENKEAEIVKNAVINSSVINTLDDNAKINYCVKLSYIYGKYGDKEILNILKERGCIEEEDIKEMEDGFAEIRR
ncbi:MAG: hypothetical protein QXW35_01645 [Candidatus Aenigmatarchaeota archaeon]